MEDYNILSDNPKADTSINGNIELSAEQARLEVVHAMNNNLIGLSANLETELADVMGDVFVAAA